MTAAKLPAAIVGLGQMGQGIARALDRAGHLVAASDRDPAQFAACDFSDTVTDGDVLRTAKVVFFVVPSTAQIEEFLGDSTADDCIIVDLTTSNPQASIALAAKLKPRGFSYVDAAMTGGAAGADAGTLTLMMGGDRDIITQIDDVLNVISSQRFRMGDIGAGHAMKLVHNLILHSSFMATCEGLSLAQRAGLDVVAATQVLNAGNARSFVTEVRFPRDILSGTMNARSRISNLEKDMALARDFASDLNGPAPYTAMTQALLSTACEQGDAERDFSWLFDMFSDLATTKEPVT